MLLCVLCTLKVSQKKVVNLHARNLLTEPGHEMVSDAIEMVESGHAALPDLAADVEPL